jgi:penicillin amidase
MERTRRIFNGRLSEIFGEDALAIDKFSRTLGYRRIAEETWETITEEKRKIF